MKEKSRAGSIGRLFGTFFKIGAFTFGGGYAMIPLIQREVVERRGWITDADILEIVAIAESTPGPIAINAATFVGYRVCGLPGALAATLGVVLPSFAIILAVARVLSGFQSVRAVRYAFIGVRAGVLALILRAMLSMYRQADKTPLSWAIMAMAFALTAVAHIQVLPVILLCAALGLAGSMAAKGERK